MLVFEDKVKNNKSLFLDAVRVVSARLGIDANWLMAVMYAESRLSPQAQNKKFPFSGGGYATGLIQFTPDTARALGTSVDELYHMNNVEQMGWVEKYFLPYVGRLKSYADVYLAVFFPAAIGKPDNWVFEARNLSRASVARSNPIIDIDGNGEITVSEFKKYLQNGIPVKFRKLIFYASEFAKNNKGLLFFALVAVGVWFVVKD